MERSRFEHKYERMVPILEELHELLVKREFPVQASIIERLLTLARKGDPKLRSEIKSGDLWGGSGAVFDVVFWGNRPGPERELRDDDRRLRWLMVRLVDEMMAAGIRQPTAEQIAAATKIHEGWH
jgi:hypothetical protein